MTEIKTIFNEQIIKKLHIINCKVVDMLSTEVEQLDLSQQDKLMAHYYIIKNHMENLENIMNERNISNIAIKRKVFIQE